MLPFAPTAAQVPRGAEGNLMSMTRGRATWRRLFPLLAVALAGLMLVACDDDGEPTEAGNSEALADRMLRLGEDPNSIIDVRSGELPEGLSEALNPGATEDTPPEDLVSLPVHPDGELLGSFRLKRPTGALTFFLFYDIALADHEVESQLSQQLNESPWQVIGGQSSEDFAQIAFQSTVSGDISGAALVQPLRDPGASAGAAAAEGTPDPAGEGEANAAPRTSILYLLEIAATRPDEAPPFELRAGRPLPERFPLDYLVLDGMTPFNTQWATQPVGDQFQIVLLTRESGVDIAGIYRDLLEGDGWQLISDEAVGFATILEFEKDDQRSRLNINIDAFQGDEAYTAVVIQLQQTR